MYGNISDIHILRILLNTTYTCIHAYMHIYCIMIYIIRIEPRYIALH